MQKLTFLNSREVKEIREELIKEFGYFLEKEYVYIKTEQDKIFLVNKDLERLDLNNLIIDRIGLYFAEFKKGQLRLSKEGAQLLMLEAKRHHQRLKKIVELGAEEVKSYFRGEDLSRDLGPRSSLVLLKYGEEGLGCARYKDRKIINFLPKIHRGEVIS